MGDANQAAILLVSVNAGGVELGTPNAVAIEETRDTVVIRNQGKIGPGARGLIAGDVICLIDFLEKGAAPPGADDSSVNDITITAKSSDGSTIEIDIDNMMTLGYSFEFNRNSPPGVWRQKFGHVGDLDSDPIT